ncbi:MAG: dihydroorotase [Oligoflexia bacterium]
MNWILRGATLQPLGQPRDLWIENGKIRAIDQPGAIPALAGTKEMALSGRWILPGLVDAHVHLREPGLEHKETIASGTRAAVAGGFTSVACMANTLPVNDCAAVTRAIVARARETALCKVYPIGAITRGLAGRELAELGLMIEAGAVALSDDGMPVMDSALMRRAMEYAKSFGVSIISHSEDLHLSQGTCMHEGPTSFRLGLPGVPAASEEIAVARDIALCRLTGARLHLAHLSTQQAIELVRRAKQDGLPITAEATPHHLSFTESAWEGYSTFCKMNPPLRTSDDVEAVVAALADGTNDLIATDHAPHAEHEKALDAIAAPNGVIGLQTAVPLTLRPVLEGRVPIARWVDSLTAAPARMLGIQAGKIELGLAADLCIIDPKSKWRLEPRENKSLSANFPPLWQGLQENRIPEFTGKVEATFVEGRLI